MTKEKSNVTFPTADNHNRYYVLVYGSLRKECHNHALIALQKDSVYHKQVKVPNYTLYWHKGQYYPYAAYVYGKELLAELWEVSELTITGIRALEKDYTERPFVVGDIACSLFYMPLRKIQEWQSLEADRRLVEIGSDWVKHCKLTNNFSYLPNKKRAAKGLPSFQQLERDKQNNGLKSK